MISFDIFDTLITRATAKPDGIFAIIQNILYFDAAYEDIPEYIRMNYYTLRIHAEELARYHNRSKGIEEITIRDIYDALANQWLCRCTSGPPAIREKPYGLHA